MSLRIELDDLPAAVAERGRDAYLVTSGPARPHVVSVEVDLVDGTLVVGAGRQTSANVAEHPEVTLLWPTSGTHPDHSLLVDGTAVGDGASLVIRPTSAIRHVLRRNPDGTC